MSDISLITGEAIILNAMIDAALKGTLEITPDGWQVFGRRMNALVQALLDLENEGSGKSLDTLLEDAGLDPLEGDFSAPALRTAPAAPAALDSAGGTIIAFPVIPRDRVLSVRDETRAMQDLARGLVRFAKQGEIGPVDAGAPDGGDAA